MGLPNVMGGPTTETVERTEAGWRNAATRQLAELMAVASNCAARSGAGCSWAPDAGQPSAAAKMAGSAPV